MQKLDRIVNEIIPESKKYEKIQKEKADFIIDGNQTQNKVLSKINKYLKK